MRIGNIRPGTFFHVPKEDDKYLRRYWYVEKVLGFKLKNEIMCRMIVFIHGRTSFKKLEIYRYKEINLNVKGIDSLTGKSYTIFKKRLFQNIFEDNFTFIEQGL